MLRPTTVVLPIAVMAMAIVSFLLFIDLSIYPPASQAAKDSATGNTNGTTKKDCLVTGCGGQVCSDTEVISTCQYVAEYACYPAATCARQADGGCGWTMTPELTACLSKATDTNTTVEERPTLTVPQAVDGAEQYNGQEICLRGDYQSSFEFSAFVGSFQTVAGSRTATEPYIWNEVAVDQSALTCEATQRAGQQICTGTTTACGIFRYHPDGEGFGHLGVYQYVLDELAGG